MRYCLREFDAPLEEVVKEYQNPQRRTHLNKDKAQIIREEMDKKNILPHPLKKETTLSM